MQNLKSEFSDSDILAICHGVVYRAFGSMTFVRNVHAKKEFLFNRIVCDIFDAVKSHSTLADVCRKISAIYDGASQDQIHADTVAFLGEMIKVGLVEKIVGGGLSTQEPIETIGDKIEDYCVREKRLFSACLELTYRCNERCSHCYIDDENNVLAAQELCYDDYRRICLELEKMGCMHVLVTGGEPTLRPDFIDICKLVVDNGMLLDVYTNGLDVRMSTFKELSGLGVNSVSVSLYGGSAAFHDSITHVPGSFERTLRTLMAFKCAGVEVFVKTVLLRGHIDEYVKLKEICESLKISVHAATVLAPGQSGKSKDYLNPSESDLETYYSIEKAGRPLGQLRGVKNLTARDPDSLLCNAGHVSLSINPYGEVFPCNSYPCKLGDVKRETIEKIWQESEQLKKVRSFRFHDLAGCESCQYAGLCNICPGIAFELNQGHIKPHESACRSVRKRFEVEIGFNVSDVARG